MITQEELKELFNYDEETGDFIRIKGGKGRVVGTVAGNINNTGHKLYVKIYIGGKIYAAHRLAFLYMTGNLPENQTDHIDGDGTNNAWLNLRDVTAEENARNRKLTANNSSGVVGVCWAKQMGKWQAYIRGKGKNVHLGFYDDIRFAKKARKEAEVKYGYHKNHGEMRCRDD